MSEDKGKSVGIQIGGTVGPEDKVAMHVTMPTQPGTGVTVNINDSEVDNKVKEIMESISSKEMEAEKIRAIAREVLEEKDQAARLQKIKTLIDIGSGITSISTKILGLKEFIGL